MDNNFDVGALHGTQLDDRNTQQRAVEEDYEQISSDSDSSADDRRQTRMTRGRERYLPERRKQDEDLRYRSQADVEYEVVSDNDDFDTVSSDELKVNLVLCST